MMTISTLLMAAMLHAHPPALPAQSLRPLIADETRTDRALLVERFMDAAGKGAIADLKRWLGEERRFWDNLGLNLDEESKVSRPRFDYLVELLRQLDKLGYRDDDSL